MPVAAPAEKELYRPFGRKEEFAQRNVLEDQPRVEYRDADGKLLFVEDLYGIGGQVANGYPVDSRGRRHGMLSHFNEQGKLQEECDYVHDVIHGTKTRYLLTQQGAEPIVVNTTEFMNGEKNGLQTMWPKDPFKRRPDDNGIDYNLDDNRCTQKEWEENKPRVEQQWQERLRELEADLEQAADLTTDAKPTLPVDNAPVAAEATVIAKIEKGAVVKSDWYAEPGPTENTLIIRDGDGKKRRMRYLYPNGQVRQENFYNKDGEQEYHSITLDEQGNVTLLTPYKSNRRNGAQIIFSADGTSRCVYYSGDKEMNPARWQQVGERLLPLQLRPEYKIEPVKMKDGLEQRQANERPVAPRAATHSAPRNAPSPPVATITRDEPYPKGQSFAQVISDKDDRRKFTDKDGKVLWIQSYYPDDTIRELRFVDEEGHTVGDLTLFDKDGDPAKIIPHENGVPHGIGKKFDASGNPEPIYYMHGYEVPQNKYKGKAAPAEPAPAHAPRSTAKSPAPVKAAEAHVPFGRKDVSFPKIKKSEGRNDYLNADDTVGYIEKLHKGGQVAEGYFVNKDGEKEGAYSKYDDGHSHQVREKGNFKNGQKDGKFREFDAKGRPVSESNFLKGDRHGPQIEYTPDGERVTYRIHDRPVSDKEWLAFEKGEQQKPPAAPAGAPTKASAVGKSAPRTRRKDHDMGKELDPSLPQCKPYLELPFAKVIMGGRGKIRFTDENGVALWLQSYHDNGQLKEVRRLNKHKLPIGDVLQFNEEGKLASIIPHERGRRHGRQTNIDKDGNKTYLYFDANQPITEKEWEAIESRRRPHKNDGQQSPKTDKAASADRAPIAEKAPADPYFKDRSFVLVKTNRNGRDTFLSEKNVRLWSQEYHPDGALKNVTSYDKFGQAITEVRDFNENGKPVKATPYNRAQEPHGKGFVYDAEGSATPVYYKKGQVVTKEVFEEMPRRGSKGESASIGTSAPPTAAPTPSPTPVIVALQGKASISYLQPGNLKPVNYATAFASCAIEVTKRYKDKAGNTYEETYYPDNKLKSEGFRDAEGRRQDLWREFHENGMVKRECPYRNNLEDGIVREYDDAGTVRFEDFYIDGQRMTREEYVANGGSMAPHQERFIA